MRRELQTHMFQKAEELANFCRLFSNPTRVMIVWTLADGEYSVGGLAEVLQTSIQNVSQHLRIMKARGFVQPRREGSVVYYTLTPKAIESDSGFLISRNPQVT